MKNHKEENSLKYDTSDVVNYKSCSHKLPMSNNALDAVKLGISDQNLIYCSLKSQEQDCGSEFIFLEKLVTILSAGEF